MLIFPHVNVNYVKHLICIYLHTRNEYSHVPGRLIFSVLLRIHGNRETKYLTKMIATVLQFICSVEQIQF